jgi:hypothetical protein
MYFNFTRINGVDIWYKPGNDTGDKGTELFGNGIRWDIGQGGGIPNYRTSNYYNERY